MYFHTQPEREKRGETNQEDAEHWETPEIVKLKELESLPKLLEIFIIFLSKSIKPILGLLCCKLVNFGSTRGENGPKLLQPKYHLCGPSNQDRMLLSRVISIYKLLNKKEDKTTENRFSSYVYGA